MRRNSYGRFRTRDADERDCFHYVVLDSQGFDLIGKYPGNSLFAVIQDAQLKLNATGDGLHFGP